MKEPLIAVYSGLSAISLVIRGFTMSPYSHAAIVNSETGRTYEAWHNPGRFRAVRHPWDQHTRGTPIRFFRHRAMTEQAAKIIFEQCETWSLLRVRYDYIQVLRFLTRVHRRGPVDRRLFCSEAVSIAFRKAGLLLLNADDSVIAPNHLTWCTDLIEVSPSIASWCFRGHSAHA